MSNVAHLACSLRSDPVFGLSRRFCWSQILFSVVMKGVVCRWGQTRFSTNFRRPTFPGDPRKAGKDWQHLTYVTQIARKVACLHLFSPLLPLSPGPVKLQFATGKDTRTAWPDRSVVGLDAKDDLSLDKCRLAVRRVGG